jgi:hypothetical protein
MTINGSGEYRKKIEIISLTEFRRQECERMQQFGDATGMRPNNLDLSAEEWTPDYELAKRLTKMKALIEDIKALRDLPNSLREYATELHKQSIPEVVARALERFLELSTMPHDDKWQAAFDSVRGIVVDTTPPGTKQKLRIDAPSLVPAEETGEALLETRKASSYKMRAIEWLWMNRFAYGKLGLLGGLPDLGKGLITAFLMACVTNGREFPCNEGKPPRKGSVIYLSAEDDIEDTIVPRFWRQALIWIASTLSRQLASGSASERPSALSPIWKHCGR